MQKNLSIIIKANQDFIRYAGDLKKQNIAELNGFYENISDVYIPLLNLMERLSAGNIRCRLGLVLPPVLCAMLSAPELQEGFVDWLDARIALAESEAARCHDDGRLLAIIRRTNERNLRTKTDFIDKYQKDLLRAFIGFQQSGILELLGTCGTDLYLPHYADLREIVSAQVEAGLHAYKQFFGEIPDGFWLPCMGYAKGLERIIRAYGYGYTVLDPRSLLLAKELPEKGTYYPVRAENSLVLFANDYALEDELFGEGGYASNAVYRNEHRDIGFEIPSEQLSDVMEKDAVRCSTGFKYWSRGHGDAILYDEDAAFAQARADAKAFLEKRADRLEKAAGLIGSSGFVSVVCALDADMLKQGWYEAFVWLETVFAEAPAYGIQTANCRELISAQYSLEKFTPYYSAASGFGYGENLLSSRNCWMMRYVRKASERMIDLADRFPGDTGLKSRLLNLAAKELMLSQSVTLAKMIDEGYHYGYAEERFRECIQIFTEVFDSLGSNTVSTEWLTTLEAKDSLFPWMNYRIFARKR